MTKYRLDRDPDTGNPCMVADPDGIYYSAGEVDRELETANELAKRPSVNEVRLATKLLGMQENIEERDRRIQSLTKTLERRRYQFDENGLLRPLEESRDEIAKRDDLIRRLRDFLKDCTLFGFYYCMVGMGDNYEKMMEEADAAGTHDGGTVPEGDRPSPGPAAAREDEGNPE